MSTKQTITRREALVRSSALIAGGALALGVSTSAFAEQKNSEEFSKGSRAGGSIGLGSVVTPNGSSASSHLVDGVRVFHLIAEEVVHEFAPGIKARCWGYNGSVHGPTIEATEGERVRIFVTNRLPEATTLHCHGLLLPNGMDGVGGLTQKSIPPGATFKYEFDLKQFGTYMYHSHHDEMTQMALGMTGLFVIHPKSQDGATADRDFALMLHEWRVDPGSDRPNPNEMTDFNLLTINGKVFPATAPLIVRTGERVRIRIGNLSAMDHHPIHLHGYRFVVTETDGGIIPESARYSETTVLVPVGTTRTLEFVADAPGDWAMHCHMTHHVMNQMGHQTASMIGVDRKRLDKVVGDVVPGYMTMGESGSGDMGDMHMAIPENSIPMLGGKGLHGSITMGGMFTILKVRDSLDGERDPGWYQAPDGTLSEIVTAEELRKNGIKV